MKGRPTITVQHGQDMEAEVRGIREHAAKPNRRVRLGDALAALGRRIGLIDEDFAVFEEVHDKVPAEPLRQSAFRQAQQVHSLT